MRYKTVLLGWTPYQNLHCSLPDTTIFPTPKDIFNSLFLILSLLCLSILQEILLKDFSLTYLTVTFLLAAHVLSSLILTSRAAIFILSLRDGRVTQIWSHFHWSAWQKLPEHFSGNWTVPYKAVSAGCISSHSATHTHQTAQLSQGHRAQSALQTFFKAGQGPRQPDGELAFPTSLGAWVDPECLQIFPGMMVL